MTTRSQSQALGGAVGVAVLLLIHPPVLPAQEGLGDPGGYALVGAPADAAAYTNDPTADAIRWVDRAAIQVRCAMEQELQECGCWPPRGAELYALRAICDFQQQARVVRIEARRGLFNPVQLRRLASAAWDVERLTARLVLPCATDLLLQDALDLAVFLGAAT
jgi:hypothetical protein